MTLGTSHLTAIVSVNALIVRDGALLLVQSGRLEKRGLWMLPGGKMDLGETFDQALAREVQEETGIAPAAYTVKKLAILHDRPTSTVKHLFELVLNPDAEVGQPADTEEIQAIWWMLLEGDEILALPFRSDWIPKVIRDYREGVFGEGKVYSV